MSNKQSVFIGAILSVVSFILRYLAFQQTEYANGWDAYYYLIQIKALLNEGAMHSTDYSLIYPLLILIYKIFGDYILAFKLVSALTAALTTLGVFLISMNSTKSSATIIAVSSIAVFSPTLTFFASQFPKNLLGIAFLLFFIYFLQKRKLLWIIIFACFAVITHRFSAGLFILFLGIWLINKKNILYFVGIAGALALISIVVPGAINIADLERFNGFFSSTPQLATHSFIETIGPNKISLLWLIELIVAPLGFVVAIIVGLKNIKDKNKKAILSMMAICLVLIFPFFSFTLSGPAYRFFIVFMALAPLFFIFVFDYLKNTYKYFSAVFILAFSFFSYKSYDPQLLDPPYKEYEVITKNSMEHIDTKSTKLVIAHKALAEYFTFNTNIDALPWKPEDTTDINTSKRICYGIEMADFKYYLSNEVDSIQRIGLNYCLIDESVWEIFTKKVEESRDDQYLEKVISSWQNPYKQRPNYLLKNKN